MYASIELNATDKVPFSAYAERTWGKYNNVDFSKLSEELRSKYILLKNPKAPTPGRYTLIFDPKFMESLFYSIFVPALNFKNLSTNRSFLSGKLNQNVFSELLTVESNPFIDYFSASALLDRYGSKTTRKYLFESGVFSSYLSDLQSAGEFNGQNTGNWFYEIAPDNLIIPAGSTSVDALLADVKQGIYVYSALGVHTADYSSGNLSIAVDSGWMVRNGEYVGAIKDANIAINVLDLFSNLYAKSKERVDTNTAILPTLFFESIALA